MDGFKIKELRKKNKMTQQKLASILNVDTSLISKWEKGIAIPSNDLLIKLCNQFNVSSDYLLGRDEAPTKKPIAEEHMDYNEFSKALRWAGITQEQLKNIDQKQIDIILSLTKAFNDIDPKQMEIIASLVKAFNDSKKE